MSGKRTFRDAWLQDELYRDWLSKSEDPTKARCKACKTDIKADTTSLKRHRSSKIHSDRMPLMEASASPPPAASTKPKDHLVTRAEIKLATFFCRTQHSYE